MSDVFNSADVQLLPQGLDLSQSSGPFASGLVSAPTSLAGNLLGNITWPKFALILGVGAIGITLLATPAASSGRR